jgi:hypothetical protein
MYCSDDAVLVASDVEYKVRADAIHGTETSFQRRKAAEISAFHGFAPRLQWRLCVPVVGGEC